MNWVGRTAVVTVIAVGGILGLGLLMYERYLAERPVPAATDSGPDRVTAPIAGRVVLVIIDSLRADAAADPEVMPAWARVAAAGASGINLTPDMTLTTMSVVAMATGMTPPISWSLKNFDIESFEDESAFSLVGAHHGVALLGDASWTQLFGPHAKRTLSFKDKGMYSYTGGGITVDDQQTLDAAAEALADPALKLVVIHVTSSDKAAHKSGAHVREADGSLSDYGQALNTLDAAVGALYAKHSDATWLLLSDHGCSLRGNHGGGEDEARRAPFAWAGPGIAAAADVLQPLNAVAPTITSLFGLRAPRIAETPAAADLLTHDAPAREALASAHLRARRAYVQQVVVEAGADVAVEGDLAQLFSLASTVDQAGRRWQRPLGLAVGLALMVALMAALAGWKGAAVWAALSWLLLIVDGWQFPAVQLLGEIGQSLSGFAARAAIIAALAAAGVVAARRVPNPKAAAWIAWGVVVLAIGQSVMRWPYGPLPEMYRSMMILGAIGAAALANDKKRAVGLLALLAGLYAAAAFFGLEDALDNRAADSSLLGLANVGFVAAIVALCIDSVRSDRSARSIASWCVIGAVAIMAVAYQATGATWLIKLLLVLCLLPLAGARGRHAVVAVGLIAYRALAIDARVLILLGVALVAWVASGAKTKNSPLTTPAACGFALLLQHSYFYEAGYSISFSALDMSVAFAATRDAIDLGQGFFFILAQGLGPWLVIVPCVLFNRASNDDAAGVRAAIVAMVGAFVIQAWGAFGSFEYQIDNHWFTMHAVPLMLFTPCNALLVGVAVLASYPAVMSTCSTSGMGSRQKVSAVA